MSETEQEITPDTEPEPEPEPETTEEQTEDGEPDPDTPFEEQEPENAQTTDEPPVDDKQIEKAFKALGKVREYVARRVGEIMGDDATQLIPCPACADLAPGFVWPPNVAALSPEAEAGTRLLLGMQQPTDLEPHPNATICETCQGKGQVQTPSKVPGYDVVDCPACSATGRILTPSPPVLTLTPTIDAPAQVVTGPTVMPASLSPEAEAAKAQGYMVIAPPDLSTPAPSTA